MFRGIKEFDMKKYLIVLLFCLGLCSSQSPRGSDLLSDMAESNKNEVYVYWIGTVNGTLEGYKFGSQFTLDMLAKDGIITERDKTVYLEALKFKIPNNMTEQQLFNIVWRYINKHPEKRHMDLSVLTFMAINESLK